MPEIGRIQSTTFQALLTRLGIVRNEVPFVLRSEVSPVVLVGGEVQFIAAPTPAYGVVDFFSAGVVIAPAINTVLADSGQLSPGAYTLSLAIFAQESNDFNFEWRNAANTANLVSQRFRFTVANNVVTWNIRLNLENQNERFRVINLGAGGVGIDYNVGLFVKI